MIGARPEGSGEVSDLTLKDLDMMHTYSLMPDNMGVPLARAPMEELSIDFPDMAANAGIGRGPDEISIDFTLKSGVVEAATAAIEDKDGAEQAKEIPFLAWVLGDRVLSGTVDIIPVDVDALERREGSDSSGADADMPTALAA